MRSIIFFFVFFVDLLIVGATGKVYTFSVVGAYRNKKEIILKHSNSEDDII